MVELHCQLHAFELSNLSASQWPSKKKKRNCIQKLTLGDPNDKIKRTVGNLVQLQFPQSSKYCVEFKGYEMHPQHFETCPF